MRNRLDPPWLDAQYNNRALVPNHAHLLDNWARASAAARAGSPAALLDVRYGDEQGQTLDLFPALAPRTQPAPVLIYIHGGYWRALDKSDHSFVAPAFNADGAMVVVPNYALCPAVSIEQIVLQLVQAVAWVWRHAAAHGGDPSCIALAGHSAGGHLATMLLSCRWKEVADDLPTQPVTGALAISGLYDLEPLRHTPFLQADLQLTPAAVARLSPAFFPRPKGAKLYTAVGLDESEEFQRQNRLIRDVWGPTAVPVCESLAGANHFTVLQSLADPAGRLHELALRLLQLH
ncbi:Alpha/beta hydrolase [Rubrivivax sp. A210]|uniref:alpha/beta hydrolase n=1 Tax=Rubrivivax sp. A210 TaxID=2772301 RepID=UPI00191A2F95|nr:alpha/beta hydrolase [Rubrivivax sp. A210]CAD5371991.1 Alpha/beta hydrolase [Rubrivivax sp. A210]